MDLRAGHRIAWVVAPSVTYATAATCAVEDPLGDALPGIVFSGTVGLGLSVTCSGWRPRLQEPERRSLPVGA